MIVFAVALLSLSACASISEEECQIGAWSEYGYRDGARGTSSDIISDYAKTCAEYNVRPDMDAYLSAFARGAEEYCTYERGFETGETGGGYNQVCAGARAVDYAPGYDEGRALYEIYSEHENLINQYEATLDDIVDLETRLASEDLDDAGRQKLKKRQLSFEDKRQNLRRDIRRFERRHDLPYYDFDVK